MEKIVSKKNVLGLFIVIILSLGLSWVWGHGYIEVSASESGGSKDFSIINSAGVASKISSPNPKYRWTVKKGSYQVLVSDGTKNYYAFVETKGLLRKTVVAAKLATEKSRVFVGNNPSPCMTYFGDLLYSTECGESIRSLSKHIPAEGYMPSYTQSPSQSLLYGQFEGVSILKDNRPIALLKDVEGFAGYFMQVLNNNEAGGERVRLEGPNPNLTYSVQAYKEGVLLYSPEDTDAYYVDPSRGMQVTKVSLGLPNASGLLLQKVFVQDDRIVSVYSDNANLDILSDEESHSSLPKDPPGKTEVIVSQNNTKVSYTLPFIYNSAAICGRERLCVVGIGGLTVYDISLKTKPKLLHTIPLVTELIDATDSGARFITKLGILSYNSQYSDGSIEYTFGKYAFCGHKRVAEGSLLLCLIDTKQNKVGLLLTKDPLTGGAIDKQVITVLSSEDVSAVSVYKNKVLVIPSYPERYSSLQASQIADSVDAIIKQSGIDQSVYSVINIGRLQ